MSSVTTNNQLPKNTPNRKDVSRSKTNLRNCGCLEAWDRFDRLSAEGRRCELTILRFRRCIEEQCWASCDVAGLSLTAKARSEPFPDVVRDCLINKLKNARSIKKEAFESICEQRRLLENGHRSCYDRAERDLKVLFGVTKAQCQTQASKGEIEIDNEITGLIRGSVWAKLVDVSRVRNLTTDQVSAHELEVLSLGIDFRLQGAKKSILDTVVAFHKYETMFRNEPGKPDLQRDKTKLISSMNKDNRKVLPRRYDRALISLKANKNVMVVQSDKGKETVVCYRTTYLALLDDHFSDTNYYHPVSDRDIAGHDLEHMTDDFKRELNLLAANAPDEHHKKIIKGLGPPDDSRFPAGRINLKTHKSGITHTHVPVRPIVSNTKSPTSVLASYLGKCLTRNLGQVSSKHIGSTEEFASYVKGVQLRAVLCLLTLKTCL